jgi:hypothetical protein
MLMFVGLDFNWEELTNGEALLVDTLKDSVSGVKSLHGTRAKFKREQTEQPKV